MKGQMSIEAVIVMGMAIVILVSMVNLNWERFNLARETGEAGEARLAGELLATAINTAYSNGEGFRVRLNSEDLNYTRLGSTKIEGIGINLPIVIDTREKSVNISKTMSRTGVDVWNISIPIIPANIIREAPSSQYPETTIRNNGTYIVIYAENSNVRVV